jgi:hypothetical protein
VRAPVALANEERIRVSGERDKALGAKDVELAARDDEIATLRERVDEYKATLDHEAPKLALIEQLRKLDGIGGLSMLALVGKSDEDTRERLEKDVAAGHAWEFETRQIIRKLIPQYERDFATGPMLPFNYFPKRAAKPPTIQEIQAWKAAKRDVLSQIIKEL